MASNQTHHNPMEEANGEDTDQREEEEDKTPTEEWWCPSPPDYALTNHNSGRVVVLAIGVREVFHTIRFPSV
ncbi:hypothetical protein NDU88_006025 [Pleurodeles waltl]|uniref:Uncharacterized protein n=1 Tax=Pleurodeles waltl TaxID=8319 RepID=A0AAV7LYZ7_PLEWA|nr:hypothetical protein NDU88_006025 [Pleurodeles waltl]